MLFSNFFWASRRDALSIFAFIVFGPTPFLHLLSYLVGNDVCNHMTCVWTNAACLILGMMYVSIWHDCWQTLSTSDPEWYMRASDVIVNEHSRPSQLMFSNCSLEGPAVSPFNLFVLLMLVLSVIRLLSVRRSAKYCVWSVVLCDIRSVTCSDVRYTVCDVRRCAIYSS